ncbi:MAG TPA: alpha/beta hydrolase [Magnetospirillaceae bacterium]|nr:alpha/beta hydrolase [Magnetospirillaceae bacterium]
MKRLLLGLVLLAGAAMAEEGSVTLPSAIIPFSAYASPEARHYFETDLRDVHPNFSGILEARAYYDKWNAAQAARARDTYAVEVRAETIAGVQTDVITPKGGVAQRNRNRVLINLHGGAFAWGARDGGQAESIPVAALGVIEVITVDYREGPENHFPAASEDVAKVYAELLKTYRPENIGIFGCSAGGILTAESVAWFQRHDLPRPGAIAMLCSGAKMFAGDSAYLAPILNGGPALKPGEPPARVDSMPYFAGADAKDPLVLPGVSDSVMAQFPPTAILTGTRDFAMSAALDTANQLGRLGVEVDLHVWDGMSHAFMMLSQLPEAREANLALAKFFERHLGTRPIGGANAQPSP